jgi:phosphoribosylanthranilate isomerase
MTAVKICGLTRKEDVAAAVALGADLLGFNFAASSPRCISVEKARELAAGVPPGTLRVGVFVREDRDAITRAVFEASLDLVQLHRPVHLADVVWSPVPIIAAVGAEDPPQYDVLPRLSAILWDASTGRGSVGDWSALAARRRLPVRQFLAGGLTPDNVGDAIRRLRPEGVDVASGVESAPGIKDPVRLERFFAAVREADHGAA